MLENSVIKSIGLLAVILVGVVFFTFEVAEFFLKEKEFRRFWLKIWLVVAGIISIFLWLILLFWEK